MSQLKDTGPFPYIAAVVLSFVLGFMCGMTKAPSSDTDDHKDDHIDHPSTYIVPAHCNNCYSSGVIKLQFTQEAKKNQVYVCNNCGSACRRSDTDYKSLYNELVKDYNCTLDSNAVWHKCYDQLLTNYDSLIGRVIDFNNYLYELDVADGKEDGILQLDFNKMPEDKALLNEDIPIPPAPESMPSSPLPLSPTQPGMCPIPPKFIPRAELPDKFASPPVQLLPQRTPKRQLRKADKPSILAPAA